MHKKVVVCPTLLQLALYHATLGCIATARCSFSLKEINIWKLGNLINDEFAGFQS